MILELISQGPEALKAEIAELGPEDTMKLSQVVGQVMLPATVEKLRTVGPPEGGAPGAPAPAPVDAPAVEPGTPTVEAAKAAALNRNFG